MAKILLAEDEEILMMLIRDTLEDEGYEIDEANDGVEAFELLQNNDYDLVILDFMMPRMTGLEVVEKTRKSLNKIDLKMMILSAKNQQDDRDLVMKTGADYFMTKPFSPQQLIETIEDILHD
ncbi:response regulator transcription factor [Fictibacillus aquaticus]|uniref:Response regulator n=1 Tax=Fictibacillus aquaticus TaxID=2021314 RepID=A0A235FCD6_9BACL|nr:response regulator [Fictibacillus aquaticus]OYD58617.1 response regulator [Fictibacillus aquaticus]